MSVTSYIPNYGAVSTKAVGHELQKDYKLFFIKNGKKISPWHSLPAFVNKEVVNMVCEIPRGTNAKMEINTKEKFNPIKQDLNKDKTLRFRK